MKNFRLIRELIKPGDILLSRKPGSPISEIIQDVIRSRWSHSFLYIGNDKIIESDWDGVVINPLSKYFDGNYELGLFRIQPELTKEEQVKLIDAAFLAVGTKYAYLQLVWGFILRLLGKSENRKWNIDTSKGMICSELIARCYKKIGRPLKNLPPSQMEPADLDESKITIRLV